MERVLITETIRSRQEFFIALARLKSSPLSAPGNFDAMADFLREHRVSTIIAADLALDRKEYQALCQVLKDLGITLVH